MKINYWLKLLISVAVSELAGAIGSIFTVSSINSWYSHLNKPPLSPPNWVFGPVWITLYLLMGIAASLVWKKGLNNDDNRKAMTVFAVQLALNSIWSIIFFCLKNPGAAFIEIILLWLAIIWTMTRFYKTKKTAAFLLLPYLAWVSFASYLNYTIWKIN